MRTNLANDAVIYAGSYATVRLPCRAGGCVKVAFPLPNGYALVGAMARIASGRIAHPPFERARLRRRGLLFHVEDVVGEGWARYVGTMIERIHLFVDPRGTLRTDHELRIWGTRFLRLHYRLAPAVAA